MSSFDPDRGSGVVVLDDGRTLPFDAAAFAASALRHVRPGQRLTVDVAGAGAAQHVSGLRLGTVGSAPPLRTTRRSG